MDYLVIIVNRKMHSVLKFLQMARPSGFTEEIAELICERLASGESLLKICEDSEAGMPPQTTVFNWLHSHPSFLENYMRARESWAHAEFQRMMEIADTPQMGEKTELSEGKLKITTGDMTEHRRLQIETRKWALARMFPKKYGDRQAVDLGAQDGKPFEITVRRIKGSAD